MDKLKVLIVIGSPGAGKGTQANLLSEKLGFYHFSSSKVVGHIIENAQPESFIEIDNVKYYFEEQKKLREEGKLWDDKFLTHFVKEKTKELYDDGNGILFDGAIRTPYEGEHVVPLLKKLYGPEAIEVIYIDITEDETVFRNSHRRECELIRHPVLYSEETKKLTQCQIDGSNLVERKDDDIEVIKVRLKEFREKTKPLLDIFKKQGLQIHQIDGSPKPVVVFENILKALGIK
ncbi:MAG: nucleoside monophosphate kinase [Patescibacteria group bacterium]|nr:nucleoside monophosphate kinase [Patescibacteria group bacterium]MBU1876950.1 nucleoside monophosphate kinase [Patescibacteria group bacterium]